MAGQKQQQANKKSKRQSRSPKRKVYKIEEEESNEESSSSSSSLSISSESLELLNLSTKAENDNIVVAAESKNQRRSEPDHLETLKENEEDEFSSQHLSLHSTSLSSTSPSLSSVSSSSSSSTESESAVQEHIHSSDEHTDENNCNRLRKRKTSTNTRKNETDSHLQRRKRGRPPKTVIQLEEEANKSSRKGKAIKNDDKVSNSTYFENNNSNNRLDASAQTTNIATRQDNCNTVIDSENTDANINKTEFNNISNNNNNNDDDDYDDKNKKVMSSQNIHSTYNYNMYHQINDCYVDESNYHEDEEGGEEEENNSTQINLARINALAQNIAMEYGAFDLDSNNSVVNSYSHDENTINNKSSSGIIHNVKGNSGSKTAKSKVAQTVRQTPCLLLSHPYAYLAYPGINVYKSLQSSSAKPASGNHTPRYTEVVIPIVVGSCVQLIDAESKDKSHRWTVYLRGLHNGYPQNVAEHFITNADVNKEINTLYSCSNVNGNTNIYNNIKPDSIKDSCNKYESAFGEHDNNYISHFVDKVVFILDRSFTPHVRVVNQAPFELTEEGWGEFIVNIQVHLKPEFCSSPFYSSFQLPSSPPSPSSSTPFHSMQSCKSLRSELGTQLVNRYAGGTAMRVSSSLLNAAHSPILQVNRPNIALSSSCKSNCNNNTSSNSCINVNTRPECSISAGLKRTNAALAMSNGFDSKNEKAIHLELEQEEMIAWMADVNRSYSNTVRSSFYKSPFLPPHLQLPSCYYLDQQEQIPSSEVNYQEHELKQSQCSFPSQVNNCNGANVISDVKTEFTPDNIKVENSSLDKNKNKNNSNHTEQVIFNENNNNFTESSRAYFGNNVVELNHLLRFSHRPWKPVEIPPVGDVRANANANEVLGYTLVSEPVVTERYDEIIIPFEYSDNKSKTSSHFLKYMQSLEFVLRVCWLYYITRLYRPSTRSHHGSINNSNSKNAKNASIATPEVLPSLYQRKIREESQNSFSRGDGVMPSVDAASFAHGVSCWNVLLSASDVLHNDFQWTQAYLRSVSLLAQSESMSDYLLQTGNNFSDVDGSGIAEKYEMCNYLENTKWQRYMCVLSNITSVEWKLMRELIKLPDVIGYLAFTDTLLPIASQIATAMIAEQQNKLNCVYYEFAKDGKSKSEDEQYRGIASDIPSEPNQNILYKLYIDDHKESNNRSKCSNNSKNYNSGSGYKKANQNAATTVILSSNDWSNNAKLGLCTAHLLDCELLHQLEQGLQDNIATAQTELSRRQTFLTKMQELLP